MALYRRLMLTLASGTPSASCGTGPSPDVTGTWSFASTWGGGGFDCTVSGTLTLTPASGSMSGILVEEQVHCVDNGTPITVAPGSKDLLGEVNGRAISFSPQPPEGESPCVHIRYEGRASYNRLSGTVRTTPIFCQGTYEEMTGTWQAQR